MRKSGGGIVRRIDQLGRIVVPKEMRRTLRIRVSDELEICSDGDQITIRKYSQVESIEREAMSVSKKLAEAIDSDILVTTCDHVLYASGKQKLNLTGTKLSNELIDMVLSRQEHRFGLNGLLNLTEGKTVEGKFCLVCPIVAAGDLAGAIIAVLPDENESKSQFVRFAADMLVSVLSD